MVSGQAYFQSSQRKQVVFSNRWPKEKSHIPFSGGQLAIKGKTLLPVVLMFVKGHLLYHV